MGKKTLITQDVTELCQTVASQLLDLIEQTVSQGRDFTIALTGGNTPGQLYRLLASNAFRDRIPWNRMQIFFGDERTVPPEHADSNFGMAATTLLEHIDIDPDRIHRMKGELDPNTAAAEYDRKLASLLPKGADGRPRFDLILLGLGPDGHIASLFPGTKALSEEEVNVTAVWVEKLATWRISLTLPVLNHADHIWFFVAGENKAEIVDSIFNHPPPKEPYPIQHIQPRGQVTWFMDAAAARYLDP